MPTVPIPEPLRAAAPALAERFAWIIAGLIAVIARGFLRHPTRAAVIAPLCAWLQRTRNRFNRLATQAAAGRRPRATPPRPAGRHRDAARRPSARPVALPRQYGWLVHELRHEAAFFRNQLERLLETPEAQALLEAIPTAGRLLRPLCHMLALKPAILAKPKPPRAPEPDRPCAAASRPPPPRVARPEPPCPGLARRWPWVAAPIAKPA